VVCCWSALAVSGQDHEGRDPAVEALKRAGVEVGPDQEQFGTPARSVVDFRDAKVTEDLLKRLRDLP
jgi:hypothetical protein